MRTVIVGRASNLSDRLALRLDDCVVLSARDLVAAADPLRCFPDDREYRVVINSFQTASALHDLSDPIGYVDRSIRLTARVLAALVDTPCVKVVYTSSASVYGDGVGCREDAVPRARDLHSGLKLANEQLVRRFGAEHQLDVTVARIFNMHGGSDRFSVVAKIVDAVRTGAVLSLSNHGEAVRDFVHVDDVARSYLAILAARDVPVVNVASGIGVSISSVVAAVRQHGHPLATRSTAREEISVSTADVALLSSLVEVSGFVRVVDAVLELLADQASVGTSLRPTVPSCQTWISGESPPVSRDIARGST